MKQPNKINKFEKDEYGLYIHTSNYREIREGIDRRRPPSLAQNKLDKIPKWIRKIFNAT